MNRIHLFEIEDQRWCPKIIREGTTDFLVGLYNIFDLYEPAFAKIIEVLNKTQTHTIIDCCSGSGGPIDKLRKYLDTHGKQDTIIYLTDKYPNSAVFSKLEKKYPGKVKAHRTTLDASELPASFRGLRTFFSSFHHFKPALAKKIIQDAVNNNAPIAIFECTQRHPFDITRSLISPILMPFIIPFSRRLTWQKILFTYILPLLPVTNMWDYFVSNLRTYSAKEINKIITQLNGPKYYWETGRLWSKKGLTQIPYLIGYPLH